MNIKELLNDPKTYEIASKAITQHTTVLSLGIPEGEVMDHLSAYLGKHAKADFEVHHQTAFIRGQVNLAVRCARRDFFRDRDNLMERLEDHEHITQEEQTEDPELQRVLNDALNTLTPLQRTVVIRHAIDGVPFDSLCQETGQKLERCREAYRRGIRNLGSVLETNPLVCGKRLFGKSRAA